MVDTTDPRKSQPRLIKEGLGTFSKRERKKKIAKREAKRIRKSGGSARVETIRGETVLVTLKQPTLFTASGEKAEAKDGFITGFSRADLVKKRSQEVTRAKQIEKITSREVARRFIRGGTIKTPIPFKKADISVQKAAEKVSFKEQTTRGIVQTLPSSIKVVTSTKADIPKKARVKQEEFLKEVKPAIQPLSKLQKIETTVSQKIGTKKLARIIEKFQEKRFQDFKGGVPLGSKIPEKVITGALRNPVTNTALLLGSAGVGKLIQVGGLAVAKLGTKAPKLAKTLGISGKAAGGVLGTAYIYGVGTTALNEYRKTGSFSDTTANVVRELLLFRAGSNLFKGQKLKALTSLRKELNKLPKSERVKLDKMFKKLEIKNEAYFKNKNVGVVTKLDTQQIGRSVRRGVKDRSITARGEDTLITATEKKIFISKNIPKKSGTFEVKQLFIDKKGIDTYGQATYKARFDSKTGLVKVIGKAKSFDVTVDANSKLGRSVVSGFKRFGGKKVVTVEKKVPVKAFDRKITKIKNILQLKSKNPFKDINRGEILSKTAYEKRFGKTSEGVYVTFRSGKKGIFIKDTADFRKGILNKKEFSNLLSGELKGFESLSKRANALKNVIAHEKGHSLDLKSVNRPIFDGVKNIKTDKQFLIFTNKLHNKGLLTKGKDSNYFIRNYKPEHVPEEIRAELYKNFLENPSKLKKLEPKIYNNILNALKKEGVIPTIKRITKKTSVKISVKSAQRTLKSLIGIEKKVKVSEVKTVGEVKPSDQLVQFTINPKTKKLKVKKSGEFVKPAPKFTRLVVVGGKGGLDVKIGTKTTVLPELEVATQQVSKPVIKVDIVTPTDSGLVAIPLKRGVKGRVEHVKPIIKSKATVKKVSKPVVKLSGKTVSAQTIKSLPKSLFKPKIGVSGKSKPSQVIKPIIKVGQERAQVQKPKVKVSLKQEILKKKRGRFISTVKPLKPIKIKPFVFLMKGEKVKKISKKDKLKPQILFFTKTLARPKKKRKDEDDFISGKVKLFTGAELR